MLVGDRMTREVITITDSATVADGLRLMNERDVNRLPVLDSDGHLCGIVSDMDLRIAEAAGSLATPVGSVMTKRLITVGEYCPLEEAAMIMRQKRVGGLPVVRGNQLVGIITDGDIFDVFAQLLGVGSPGIRLTAELPSTRAAVALLQELADRGGDIVGLGTMVESGRRLLTVKASGITTEDAHEAPQIVGATLLDALEEH